MIWIKELLSLARFFVKLNTGIFLTFTAAAVHERRQNLCDFTHFRRALQQLEGLPLGVPYAECPAPRNEYLCYQEADVNCDQGGHIVQEVVAVLVPLHWVLREISQHEHALEE